MPIRLIAADAIAAIAESQLGSVKMLVVVLTISSCFSSARRVRRTPEITCNFEEIVKLIESLGRRFAPLNCHSNTNFTTGLASGHDPGLFQFLILFPLGPCRRDTTGYSDPQSEKQLFNFRLRTSIRFTGEVGNWLHANCRADQTKSRT